MFVLISFSIFCALFQRAQNLNVQFKCISGQFDRANSRRGVQKARRLRSEENVWRNHSRYCPCERFYRSGKGQALISKS